ncbi:efflux RND transporter periplasmic adaptor subunit [Alsobacter sp. R-9]
MRKTLATLALAIAVWQVDMAGAGEIVVQPSTVKDMKAVFGQVQSRDTVPARARIGGTLVSRAVEEGSSVRAGDVIAVVSDEKLGLQLQAVDARIKALQAQLDNARGDLERSQSLMARGAETQSRLDQLRTAANVLVNQIEAAQAERAVVVQQSTEGQVLAPKDGRILTTPAIPGSVVLPGETVARVAAGGYYLRLALPERHASRIAAGDRVSVGGRGQGIGATEAARREGRIVKVYPELEGGRVIADAEVPGLGDFFVGERVPVWIVVGEREALLVPAGAILRQGGVDYVRIAGEGGPRDVAVIVGPVQDGRVEVLSGLRAGDRVVTP